MNSQEAIIISIIQGNDAETWASSQQGWRIESEYSVCFWQGIQCDVETQEIIEILLPNIGVNAAIPEKLGELRTLRRLSMPNNKLHGTIPQNLANLPKLESIDLRGNELTGKIPQFGSVLLRKVLLGNNILSGHIPKHVGQSIPAVEEFDIGHNNLVGFIPSSFASMKYVESLILSGNELTGSIPSVIGNLNHLSILHLDNNNLMGPIPPSLAKKNSHLREIWLQSNLLSGTIPNAFSSLEHLESFYIDRNKFTGTVPSGLCHESLNSNFSDESPCSHIACPIDHTSKHRLQSCKKCGKNFINPYLGGVGSCIYDDQESIMNSLKETLSVHFWTENHYCKFTGVTCDKKDNVIAISLSHLGLRGPIPNDLGFLPFLQSLDLSDNLLTGFLPSDLSFPPLEHLDISGNMLKGIVPIRLCEKPGINSNGKNGLFDCENIACPQGTYNSIGRGSSDLSHIRCAPCDSSIYEFLGSKICYSDGLSFQHVHQKRITPFVLKCIETIFGVIFLLSIFKYFLIRRERSPKLQSSDSECDRSMNSSATLDFLKRSGVRDADEFILEYDVSDDMDTDQLISIACKRVSHQKSADEEEKKGENTNELHANIEELASLGTDSSFPCDAAERLKKENDYESDIDDCEDDINVLLEKARIRTSSNGCCIQAV